MQEDKYMVEYSKEKTKSDYDLILRGLSQDLPVESHDSFFNDLSFKKIEHQIKQPRSTQKMVEFVVVVGFHHQIGA